MKYVWLKYVVLGLMVSSVAFTGCKKKPKGGAGLDGDNIGGVIGEPIDGLGLGERFGADGAIAEGMFQAVYFSYDSSQIESSERGKLEQVANHLQRSSDRLIVEGHCDERGSREYNLALGERRALAVRAYLVGLGVDANAVQTRSMGEESPASFGHDENAWSANRRAEFLVVQ